MSFSKPDSSLVLKGNLFIQCSISGSKAHGGAFYTAAKNTTTDRNCMYKCATSYRCAGFFVNQNDGYYNSTGDVLVECKDQGDSSTNCGGSWTRKCITKQMNASHNNVPSRRYVFFIGYSGSIHGDYIYQVIQTSLCMNSATEPLESGRGNFYFDSLNMTENKGSGKLIEVWSSNSLIFTNSIFFGNTHTAFGPTAMLDSCAFCENGFTSDNSCDQKRRTNRAVGCVSTRIFSVSEQIFSVLFFLWTSLEIRVMLE